MDKDKENNKGKPSLPSTSVSWMKMLEKASGKPFEIKSTEIQESKKVQKNKPSGKFTSNAILLIDCSGSMAGNNKLEQAKAGALDFAEEAIKKNYGVGIVSFSKTAKKLSNPTTDTSTIKSALKEIYLDSYTNISSALLMGVNMIENQAGPRVLALVTDGQPTEDSEISIRIADEAKVKGIDIITIGTDDADLEYLQRLASTKELASHVDSDNLSSSIAGLAELLPDSGDSK